MILTRRNIFSFFEVHETSQYVLLLSDGNESNWSDQLDFTILKILDQFVTAALHVFNADSLQLIAAH